MSDAQTFNDARFDATKDNSWDQVIAAVNSVFTRLAEQVMALSEGEISDPDQFKVEDGRPIWRTIVGTVVLHSFQHLVDFYLKHDSYARAEQIAKNTITIMSKFADSSHRAEAVYNLGCFYALANEPAKALVPIAESFKLSPALIDLAKQDTDLDSLRALPEFQALLT